MLTAFDDAGQRMTDLDYAIYLNKTEIKENEEKIIYFDSIQKKFVIINKKANEIVGFAGEFDFDKYSVLALSFVTVINSLDLTVERIFKLIPYGSRPVSANWFSINSTISSDVVKILLIT